MIEKTFLGLQPYTEADAYRFKGRMEESQELFHLIMRNDYTVCYAESGEGKTSLLNAGVFPLLRQNLYFPIAITFTSDDYNDTPDSFDAIINRCIRDSISEFNKLNKRINVQYNLSTTDFNDLECKEELQRELSHYSWWRLRNYKPQALGLTFTPVFVFDQFEEVFTLPNSIVWTKKFFDWLEELSSDSCPDIIIKRVRSLIGDKEAFPSIKEEKDFKAIFSLRKEFIGELDYWGMQKSFIPSLKDNRYCLKPLTYKGAQRVMTQQVRFNELKVKNVLDFFVQKYSREPEKTVAENLPVIPALLLSVVCDSWEENIDFISDYDNSQISRSINIILEKFYDDALLSIVKEFREEQEIHYDSIYEEIESNIFQLVDANGKRVRRKSSELSHLNFDTKYKRILNKYRLIKISKVNAEDYVEIIHDALCPVIATKKELRLKAEKYKREKENRRKSIYKRFLSMQNPLTLGGRQIWDNKTFSFSVDNSRNTSLHNSSNRTEVLKDLLQQNGVDDGGVEQLFFDKLFRQTADSGNISLNFNDNCSKDGITAFEIETERLRTSKQLKIKKLIFKDSNNNDFYNVDGFCGILYEYDKKTGNETKREYICNGYTSLGFAIISFENYNDYGFPTKVNYLDGNGNPCKHTDGNYGVQMEYDDFGHEIRRWFLDKHGVKTPIYNGVYGLVNEYDELDRVIKQYFIDKDGKRIFDDYGFHGVKILYNEPSNELLASEAIYIDENDSDCNTPYGYCIEQVKYDNKGRVIWQLYLDKDRNEVEKIDGVYSYSKLKIGYNESDKPDNLAMYNISGNIFKIIRYSYNLNTSITDSTYYEAKKSRSGQIERKSISDDNLVHKVKYTHDKHGVLVCIEYFDGNGNAVNDSNDYSKIIFSYNDTGSLIEQACYNLKESDTLPIMRICYNYLENNLAEVCYIKYEIKNDNNTSRKVLGTIKNKQEKQVAEAKETSVFKGVLNHRNELVRIYLDENNDYVYNTPLTLRQKYDFNGNIVKILLYNISDDSPICDETGAYGWSFEYDYSTGEKRKIEYLGINALVANNKSGYAIVEFSNEVYEGIQYLAISYFDENHTPVFCEDGYHKKLETTNVSYLDDLCKQVVFIDCEGRRCDCVGGYAIQLAKEEVINESENKITVSFWGADRTPRVNEERGFHKREQIISTEKETMETCRSFKDENDILINVHEGFAKQTCKRYDSLKTILYYPFTDYKVIRFYDENDQKVDIDYELNGKTYHAYKFVVSLDLSTVFKVSTTDEKTLYFNHCLLWKYVNVIWVPVFTLIMVILYAIYGLLKLIFSILKPKQKSIPEFDTIIKITQIYNKIHEGTEYIQAPIKQFDVEEGSWIVRWNNWTYDENQDVVTAFENEFNNSSEHKVITFYNPHEKQFLDVSITGSNIGIRIQDAQVPAKEVEEMKIKWYSEIFSNESK